MSESSVIAKEEERFIKLVNFFRPYPAFKLFTRPLNIPLIIIPREHKNSSAEVRHLFLVVLSPRLLVKAPAWLESSILRYALDFAAHWQRRGERPEKHLEWTRIRLYWNTLEHPSSVPAKHGDTRLREKWTELQAKYFPDRPDLLSYRVVWSKRKQRSCLASCSIENNRVRVAGAMKLQASSPYLEPLLYHEMCHAALGEPKVANGRRIMHGREFKRLERRHPCTRLLDCWIRSGGWADAVQTYARERASALPQYRSSLPGKPDNLRRRLAG